MYKRQELNKQKLVNKYKEIFTYMRSNLKLPELEDNAKQETSTASQYHPT